MGIRTPLARAKGKGSAHEGVHHWIVQRLTAIALIPLSVWFAYSIVQLSGASYEQAVEFFRSPTNAIPMALIIVAAFWHASLGLQVIVEDYVSSKGKKIVTLLIIKLGLFTLGCASVLSIVKLNLG